MTTREELVAETRQVILGLVDAIEAKGHSDYRTRVLLKGVEIEGKLRRWDRTTIAAARAHVADLLAMGELWAIRDRYSPRIPPQVQPVDLDALNPPVFPRPPAPRPASPHPVVHGLQSAIAHHGRTTDDYVRQMRALQQVIDQLAD